MENDKQIQNTGLRGVTIASTKISDVDGAIGKLVYRGFLAKDLAGKVSFEEVAYLLLYEKLPDKEELRQFKKRLVSERALPGELIDALETRPKDALPMDILQAAVAMLAHHDPDAKEHSRDAAMRIAIRLIAKFPTIVAAWECIRNNKKPLEPNPELDHAANFLYMLTGETPDGRT